MPSNRQKNGHSAFKGASLFSSLPPDMKRVLRQQTFEPLEMIGKVSGGPPSSSSSVGQLIATQPESQSDSAIEKQEKYQSGISLSPAASSSNSSKRKKFKSGASSMNVQSGLTNGHGKRDRDTAQNAYGISEYEEGKSKGKARAADVDHGNGDHLDDEHAHQSPSTAGQAQGRGGTINVGFEEGKQHPWNVTGLVERYENWDSVPHNVRKYYAQRLSLFHRHDTHHILMDSPTGWFSVTPERIARHIAERCRSDTVLDGFAGVGGNAIQFARTCERVIAIDNDITRLKLARHNALQYGVADRIEFICADFIQFVEAYAKRKSGREEIDVVFLSPPWGGSDYLTLGVSGDPTSSNPESAPGKKHQTSQFYPLSALAPVSGQELFRLSSLISPNIAMFMPRNTDVQELAELAPALPDDQQPHFTNGGAGEGELLREWVEVEEEWMEPPKRKRKGHTGGGGQNASGSDESRLKAVTAYYGALVSDV